MTIRAWSAADLESSVDNLATLLRLCVEDGASVNFLMPFPQAEAVAFWLRQRDAIRDGSLHLLVAEADNRPVGTVLLALAAQPNQPHRAEIGKLLVLPDARRRGVAAALMRGVEELAFRLGRTLLVLDTEAGSAAEPLYRKFGYIEVGRIPGYALSNDGTTRIATVIFYKQV